LPAKDLLVVFGGEMQRVGGETSSSTSSGASEGIEANSVCLDDLVVLDTTINLWYPQGASGKGPTARSGHTACLMLGGRHIVVYGGVQKHNRFPHNIHTLDVNRWHWNAPKCEGKPPKARALHSCVPLGDNSCVLFGGNDATSCFNDVHVLSVIEKNTALQWSWQQPEITGRVIPSVRCGHTAIAIGAEGKHMLVRGGWNLFAAGDGDDSRPEHCSDACFVLDLEAWKWGTVSLATLVASSSESLEVSTSLVDTGSDETTYGKCLSASRVGERCVKMENGQVAFYGGAQEGGAMHADLFLINEEELIRAVSW